MAHQLDPMDLKQIITLQLKGQSNRQIASLLRISRNTVNRYTKLFAASGLPLSELLTLDNLSLKELFPARTNLDNERYDELIKHFEEIYPNRYHPGFTFQYHYQEYLKISNYPYSYTQFIDHYHKRYPKEKGSMKLNHEAGREMFVDFAGKKLHIVDKQTGELQAVEVFVAILPHSQYTYVEACMSQKREDFITCLANSLSFYGGVPKAIVSDNLKSAVSRSHKYEPEINRSLKDFARHYDCVINPTRPYKPQDKALVENAVHLAYQRIYYPLREMTFFSLEDLNKEIRRLLVDYNKCMFQRKQSSRKELFYSVEKQYLNPLPASVYELKDYRRGKVQKIGHVYFSPDKSYYSVPYRYIGKHVQIQFTRSVVEVYYNYERIAIHKRNPVKGCYISNKEHLSSTHKAYSDWNPDYFREKAAKHGKNVVDFVEGILTQKAYPEVNYKRIMGVIQLHKHYTSERLDKACEIAMLGDNFSYHRVKNILKNSLDKAPVDFEILQSNTSHIPKHSNIRGAACYK